MSSAPHTSIRTGRVPHVIPVGDDFLSTLCVVLFRRSDLPSGLHLGHLEHFNWRACAILRRVKANRRRSAFVTRTSMVKGLGAWPLHPHGCLLIEGV